jgi:hypothetical protein
VPWTMIALGRAAKARAQLAIRVVPSASEGLPFEANVTQGSYAIVAGWGDPSASSLLRDDTQVAWIAFRRLSLARCHPEPAQTAKDLA